MEHSPLNMDAINQFVAYANDKAHVARRGDAQPRISIVALPALWGMSPIPGSSSRWLDIGLIGVVFKP